MNKHIAVVKDWLGTGTLNIFGAPFSGKDTQGDVLSEIFEAPLIGGGEIMRSYHDQEHLDKIMSNGRLMPHDIYLDIVIPYLSYKKYKKHPLILSAVGRSHGEGPVILRATEIADHPTKAVLFIKVSEKEIWHRFRVSKEKHDRSDRLDDSAEALRKRLQKFHAKTLPVLAFYRKHGLVIDIDGEQSPDDVTKEIINKLFDLAISEPD